MGNYIVIHKLNDATIARWDFGEEIIKATEFFMELRDNYKKLFPQRGDHELILKEESCKENFKYSAFCKL